MRDKGTNEVRALLTDVTISVIRQVIADDPDFGVLFVLMLVVVFLCFLIAIRTLWAAL